QTTLTCDFRLSLHGRDARATTCHREACSVFFPASWLDQRDMAKRNNGRRAEISRETKETKVRLSLNLDGAGKASIHTGVGFFDHMLDLLSRHSLIDLEVEAEGDLQVDSHHTVEDVGIVLGQALERALGDKRGIS